MAGNVSPDSQPDNQLSILPSLHGRSPETRPQPAERTSFVGREREVALVRDLLSREDVRVVTLTGPGGVGKTRVAIRSVAEAEPSARFVDLSDVRQPALVLPMIAAALGIRPDGRAALDHLRSVLRQDSILLLLDNFEHVLPAAAAVADLMDACRGLKLLVTSQAVLRIPGEHVVDIRPFSTPANLTLAPATDFHDVDACRLFADRARAHDADFSLTNANGGTILAICQRLDGLPLAIELAASWVSVLSLEGLLAQLDRRLALPGGTSAVAPRRQRSLREAISWSYDLLDDPSRTFFRRIACFSGGCSLEAVQEVCADPSLDVLHELRTLVANSFIRRVDSDGGETRYTMLETVREFGVERLRESNEAETILRRHATWILSLAERVEANVTTIERETWLDRLEMEQGNLHSALAWAFEQDERELGVALCGALLPYWQFRFHSGDGRAWARRALMFEHHVSPASMRKAIYCAGTLAYMHGDFTEAATHFADALTRYCEADDPEMIGRVELALGRMAWDAGDQASAQTWFDAARYRLDRCGDGPGLAVSLHYLGLLAFKDGHHARATDLLRDALTRWRSFGFTWELARCIPGHLADVARATGDMAGALLLYQECLALNWERDDLENVSWSFAGLAVIAASQSRLEDAARLMAHAEVSKALTGAPLTPHILHDHTVALTMIADVVGAERYAEIKASVRDADLAAGVASALDLRMAEPSPECSVHDAALLTRRERDVLSMISSGHSNQAIADALFLSVGTVKVHVTHIFDKLGVKSRTAAADYAHRHGLV